ncbi:MAG TPA: prepilin-type N-terminal cleavage/methylation domain-containing protein, partial [Gemmatimonadales bacterium]|nr:prepilin-type N-terminal cleavage/methylation domain-containing protein [Gemmatimonadales bacterium]
MRRRRPSRDRRGTTLIELAVVLGIVGLVTLFALPSAVRVIDQVELGSARSALVNLYQGTRMSARASNRMTVLRVS